MDDKNMTGITPEDTPLTDAMTEEELTHGRGSEEEEKAEG